MIKIGVSVLAVLTSLSALLIAGHALLVPAGAAWWLATRIAVSVGVAGTGALTWWVWRSSVIGVVAEAGLLMAAMALLASGAASAIWGLHLGLTTGDFEYWATMISMLMMGQGALTIWHLWSLHLPGTPAIA